MQFTFTVEASLASNPEFLRLYAEFLEKSKALERGGEIKPTVPDRPARRRRVPTHSGAEKKEPVGSTPLRAVPERTVQIPTMNLDDIFNGIDACPSAAPQETRPAPNPLSALAQLLVRDEASPFHNPSVSCPASETNNNAKYIQMLRQYKPILSMLTGVFQKESLKSMLSSLEKIVDYALLKLEKGEFEVSDPQLLQLCASFISLVLLSEEFAQWQKSYCPHLDMSTILHNLLSFAFGK